MIRHIVHTRTNYYTQTTIGEIFINSVHFCYTLEDTVRGFGIKVKKETAIPDNPQIGYDISIRYSSSKGRELLCLHTEDDGVTIKRHDVEFKYCDAHGGINHTHTEGCPLVAFNRNGNTIQGSAEKKLFDLVKSWIDNGDTVKWYIINLKQSN